MILSILQPVFIPDLYDLATLLKSDKVVLQNTENWSRKGRTHRAKIRTPDGTQYIHVPVVAEDRGKPINKVRIDHNTNWIDQILRSLEYNYRNSVYFDFYEPEIKADFKSAKDYEFLLHLNLFLRKRLFRFLEIEDPLFEILASDLDVYHSNPDLLAGKLNATKYYQEHDARHYQWQGKNRSKISFNHPVYRQHFDGFEPHCCLLDLLFQYGPESFRIIDKIKPH